MASDADEVSKLRAKVACADVVYDALERLIDQLDEKERQHIGERNLDDGDRFSYFPLSRAVFVQVLQNVKRLLGEEFHRRSPCEHCGAELVKKPSFVDVGCGLADKVQLAMNLDFEGHGVELDPHLLAVARGRYPHRDSSALGYAPPLVAQEWNRAAMTLYLADALAFDYSGFDVIYFYRPFRNQRMQRRLERRIWSQAKPGAFVIACASVSEPPATFRPVEDFDGYEPGSPCKVYRRRPASAGRSTRERRGGSRPGPRKI